MTLSEEYQKHAFSDLIAEAEKQGIEIGAKAERERIIKMLKSYLALTQEPDLAGEVEVNEEWDRGFQAAISVVANTYNQRSRR
jgi:hypothetical protein